MLQANTAFIGFHLQSFHTYPSPFPTYCQSHHDLLLFDPIKYSLYRLQIRPPNTVSSNSIRIVKAGKCISWRLGLARTVIGGSFGGFSYAGCGRGVGGDFRVVVEWLLFVVKTNGGIVTLEVLCDSEFMLKRLLFEGEAYLMSNNLSVSVTILVALFPKDRIQCTRTEEVSLLWALAFWLELIRMRSFSQ
ncbi:hypothetical protein HAX54_041229 [Datura stramonium]|uniref:Uncharacterized protein n=1 Tax=Datura stramonium TaxID=4076 RepID=A0ABS8VRI8_DATST|nr:hypothetical protein [Datura stramonium]